MSHIDSVRKFLKSVLSEHLRVAKGQISERTEVGRWILLLSSLLETVNVVEIGVWNGLGSTQLILKGRELRSSNSGCAIGLESNKRMFDLAKKNLAKAQGYSCLFGTVVSTEELDIDALNPQEEHWLNEDLKDLEGAPYILGLLPDDIDLLILDGGEFSTFSEFKKLQSRVRGYIVLDDTNVRKCSRILAELDHAIWQVIFTSRERNGTAVLRRKA